MLYVWDVELQEHFTNMNEDEWDKDLTSVYTIVADTYERALAGAEKVALSTTWTDDETKEEIAMDKVRLISISLGTAVDAIA